jgi:hypothetical protein
MLQPQSKPKIRFTTTRQMEWKCRYCAAGSPTVCAQISRCRQFDETYKPVLKTWTVPLLPPAKAPAPTVLSVEWFRSRKASRPLLPPFLQFKFPYNLVFVSVYASHLVANSSMILDIIRPASHFSADIYFFGPHTPVARLAPFFQAN